MQAPAAVAAAAPEPPRPAVEEECPVDGPSDHAAAGARSKFYLFTMVCELLGGLRRTPQEVGRQGLWDALVLAYRSAFSAAHPCHNGPAFGCVAQEQHRTSAVRPRREVHLHLAAAVPAEHRWKAVEQCMREVLQSKAGGRG